jgi:endonuclease III
MKEEKERTRKIIRRLRREYTEARCSLNHSNPLELLIATILSAQCTDERVNLVTADLFRKGAQGITRASRRASLRRTFARQGSFATRPKRFRAHAV